MDIPADKIEQLILEGVTNSRISEILNLPIEIIEAIADNFYDEYYDDSMDGDAATALASVGWGTDEDYGYYESEDQLWD